MLSYTYVNDNPLRFIDPDGMVTVTKNGSSVSSSSNDWEVYSEENGSGSPPGKESDTKQKGRQVKISDIPKANDIESFLKNAINYLKDGDKISGKELSNFINPDVSKKGEKQIASILSKIDNVQVDKSDDNQSASLIINTKGGDKIKEDIPTSGSDVSLRIKQGSSITLKNEGGKGVSIGLDNVGASYGFIPLPVGALKTTIQGNTLKSVKLLGVTVVGDKPLNFPEKLRKQ